MCPPPKHISFFFWLCIYHTLFLGFNSITHLFALMAHFTSSGFLPLSLSLSLPAFSFLGCSILRCTLLVRLRGLFIMCVETVFIELKIASLRFLWCWVLAFIGFLLLNQIGDYFCFVFMLIALVVISHIRHFCSVLYGG